MEDICNNIVFVGSSTGGPETLRKVFKQIQELNACVLVVQHMPIYVNESVCEEIASVTELKVELAWDTAPLKRGVIYVAPSEQHMTLSNNSGIKLSKGEKVNFVCPSVEVMMTSLKAIPKVNAMAVILTGMGSDGALGIPHVKEMGGFTMAQDEATSIIFGMPKAAIDTGQVDFISFPEKIGQKIVKVVESWGSGAGSAHEKIAGSV